MGKQPRRRLRPDSGWNVLLEQEPSDSRPVRRTAFITIENGKGDCLLMRVLILCYAALIMTSGFLFAQEPVKPQLTPRIITATKQVTMFSGLENQMLHAVQKKDKAALSSMLTEECSIHLPDADPMSGDDWVNSVMNKDFVLRKFIIRQMSAEDLGKIGRAHV